MRNKKISIQVKKGKNLQFKLNKNRNKYRQFQEGKWFIIPFLVEVDEGKSNSIKGIISWREKKCFGNNINRENLVLLYQLE